ncbi:YfdX family protein [Methylomonas sp. MgM2]
MHSIHKLASYTAFILVSALPLSFDALADAEQKKSSPTTVTNEKTDHVNKQKILAEKIQNLIREAKGALSATQQALVSLENNDAKGAKVLLEDALTKLDILLMEHPAMMLVPADVSVDVFDYEGDAKSLEKTVKQADDLLDKGRLQDARRVLSGLASELRVTTVSIPLGTYPSAIKTAIAKIDAQKIDEAKQILGDVLNTLVEETEITPLPVLRAESLLTRASEVEHKEDMTKEQSRTEVLKYTNAAKDELKIAELLGYGSKDDFSLLYTVIDDMQNEMHTERSKAAWDKIKQKLSDLKKKIANSITSK